MSLKTLRLKNKMSQSQLGRACNTNFKRVSFWENNHNTPKLESQILIAKALKMPLAQLQTACKWPVNNDIVIVGLEGSK